MSDLVPVDGINETDWIVGDLTKKVVHAAERKRDCLEWIAEKHRLYRPPSGHKLAEGVWQVSAVDCTYWVISGAPTARAQGYDIPHPEGHDPYGLEPGTCAVFERDTGLVLVWKRSTRGRNGSHIGELPVPEKRFEDAEVWAADKASRLRMHGVTEFLGRREFAVPEKAVT
jgi:hypothetical protein